MAKWRTRDRGTTRGRCAACHAEADLQLRESRFKRGWRDLFRSDFDSRVDRRVTCSVCRRTYPVAAAGARRG